MTELYLRKGADRRLRGGHLWVYSNEVDTARNPLGNYSAGDLVVVRSANGDLLGTAYMEPNALICGRLFAPGLETTLNTSFFLGRLQSALALRESCFDKPFYRLIYGDSDFLPGIVIDRFGDYLVVQLNNAGLDRYQEPLFEVLSELLQPAGILLRADSRARREQGALAASEVVLGEVPEAVQIEENGVLFTVPVRDGQKTGWFYDHRTSRARLAHWAPGKRVLDAYSYIGGWGVQAAAFGAWEVCCLDSSASALAGVEANAQLNGVGERVHTLKGSAPESMAALQADGQQFDVVILDPPAFIQRRKDLKKGITAYRRINELGLKLLAPGGLLISASCSMHLAKADLVSAMQQGSVRAGCQLRIVEQGGQGPDHPVHPAIPETEYLKAVFALKF